MQTPFRQGVVGLSHTASGQLLLHIRMPRPHLPANADLGTKPVGEGEPLLAELSSENNTTGLNPTRRWGWWLRTMGQGTLVLRSCRTETELVCREVWTFRWPETEQGEDFTRGIQQKWGEWVRVGSLSTWEGKPTGKLSEAGRLLQVPEESVNHECTNRISYII